MTNSERREFFRIDDCLPIEYRSVPLEEAGPLEERIRHRSTLATDRRQEMYFFRDCVAKEEDQETQLLRYLKSIERKLDYVIDLLLAPPKERNQIGRYTDVSISGAGIQFSSETVLDESLPVELRIVLPLFPYPTITALCSVVRARPGQADKGAAHYTALRYECINEDDRDLLVSYIFMKERERLRATRADRE